MLFSSKEFLSRIEHWTKNSSSYVFVSLIFY